MKKYLVALTVALLVCLVGISASAQEADAEAYKAAEQERNAISQKYWDIMDAMDQESLDPKTRRAIMTEVYEDAGWTVIQESPAKARAVDFDPEILELAYSDIDKADPEQRERILDARETIISSSDWYNDLEFPDVVLYMADPIKKEIAFAPPFSEVFPGWDLPRPNPVEEPAEPVAEDGPEIGDMAALDVQPSTIEAVVNGAEIARDVPGTFVYYDANTYIPNPVVGVNTANFVDVPVAYNIRNTFTAGATASYTSGLTSVNVGYQAFPSGNNIGSLSRMHIGSVLPLDMPVAHTYNVSRVGVRVSTFTTAGYANMRVDRTI